MSKITELENGGFKEVISGRGTSYFNSDGQLHREDGPAVEYKDGYKVWYINGQRHREDGPAD